MGPALDVFFLGVVGVFFLVSILTGNAVHAAVFALAFVVFWKTRRRW
jgi:hypothetical protein